MSSVIPITARQSRIITEGLVIAEQDPSGSDMMFSHPVLCQCGLPRSKVNGLEFMRKSGSMWIRVAAGMLDEGKGPVQQPVPYGAMPRLSLAWLTTYAMRKKVREIPIGSSAAEFLAMMGLDDQGARYRTLRTQMHALAVCHLQLGYMGRTYNVPQPVEQFDAWLGVGANGRQPSLWPGLVTLSQQYFDSLKDGAVPLDSRAYHALKGSALAMDIYAWLAHRLYRVTGEGTMLFWKSLRDQFGQEYTGSDAAKSFKSSFLVALRHVLMVYPQANVKPVPGGLLLQNSPPPISLRESKRLSA